MKYLTNHRRPLWALISIAVIAAQVMGIVRAVDIAPMSWNAGPRSGWINVKSPGAYTQETKKITAALVRRAAGEVYGRRFFPTWLGWVLG